MKLLSEIRRRNVFRVAAAYIVASWLIIQVVETIFPAFGFGPSAVRFTTIVLAIGLLPAIVFSWAFEITPDGLKLEKDVDRRESIAPQTGKKLDRMIMIVLAVSFAYFAIDKFVLDPQRDAEQIKVATVAAVEKALADTEEATPEHSIAVLPFVNMSSDDEQAYFSDGLSEELLNLLAKIPQLKVAARTSSFSFKGKDIDIPAIAERLKVAYVLDGSVRKSGNQLRITAQLIKAANGYHVWSETFDRELDNVFTIQNETARAVVSALQLQLLGGPPTIAVTDTDTFALYLQGQSFRSQRTTDALNAAFSAFSQAIDIDPDYAPAWVGLARTYRDQVNRSIIDYQEGYEATREAASRALELDARNADAWGALAYVQLEYDWEWDEARQSSLTALQYGPGNIDALLPAARTFRALGLLDEALEYSRRAVDVDPLNREALVELGLTYWAGGRYAESRGSFQRVLDLFPEQPNVHAFKAGILMLEGRPEEALDELSMEPTELWLLSFRPMILHSLGLEQEADRAARELIGRMGINSAYQFAWVEAWRGRRDEAFAWLETAFEHHDSGYAQIVVSPFLANLHDDPRWQPLLQKAGLLDYWIDLMARRKSGSQ